MSPSDRPNTTRLRYKRHALGVAKVRLPLAVNKLSCLKLIGFKMKHIIEIRPTAGDDVRATTPEGVVLYIGDFSEVIDWVEDNFPNAEIWYLTIPEFIPAT